MTEEVFIETRMPHWRRLKFLTQKGENSFRKMTTNETEELLRLYRQASGDLAFLAARPTNPDVINYLNSIVARSYGTIYRKRALPFQAALMRGLHQAADCYRRRKSFVAFAAGLFFGSAILAFVLSGRGSEFHDLFVPAQFKPVFEQWTKAEFEDRSSAEGLGMSFFYASNNPFVGIMTAGAGLATCGLMTVYQMYQNGVMVGALAFEMNKVGKLPFLLSSLVPHGVSEIGGIFFTAAAGFVMGWALIRPGRFTRLESLRRSGMDAFILLCTGLVMIFTAAPIEGFFSFNPAVPQGLKVAVGTAFYLGYTLYFRFYKAGEPVLPYELKG